MTVSTGFTMDDYRRQWNQGSHLVLRDRVPTERLAALFDICERACAQWREESSPGSEPGNFHYQPRAWSLLHLIHPKYHRESPEGLPTLLEAIAEPFVVALVEAIFQGPATFMQVNYYIDPPGETFGGAWHRDCQFLAPDEARERIDFEAEAEPPRELHMHIPLVPTAATSLVPGSHARWDTPEELKVRRHDPNGHMPGAFRIGLEPGDLAFFHVNALHRGHYEVGVPRRTIAVTFGRASAPRAITADIMRERVGYGATYQPWFLNLDYLDGIDEDTRAFYQRFIEVYSPYWKPEFLIPELGEKRIAYFRDALACPAGSR